MKLYKDAEHKSEILRVVLRPMEAAESLGMCRSTLEKNLHPNGACVPYFRLGTRLHFAVRELEKWAHEQIVKQQQTDERQRNMEKNNL